MLLTHHQAESSNVLLDRSIKIKVADFGLSKRHALPQDGSWGGTFTHMAPECFQGFFSQQSDVYAFGMTSWEILTQDWPLREFSSFSTLKEAVVERQCRPDLSSLSGSNGLHRMLSDCWQHESHLRPLFHSLQTELAEMMKCEPATKQQWRALEDLLVVE